MRWFLLPMAATALCGVATIVLAGELEESAGETLPCPGEAKKSQVGDAEQTPSAWVRSMHLSVLAHDVGGLWSGFRREGGVDFNAEIVFARPCATVLSGALLPNLGVTVNDSGDTSKLYGGFIWEFQDDVPGVFFNVGVGAAVHNGELRTRRRDKKALGSRVLFRIPFEFGYQLSESHRLSVMYAHVSNAYFADPNEGLDTLGIRYGYRF